MPADHSREPAGRDRFLEDAPAIPIDTGGSAEASGSEVVAPVRPVREIGGPKGPEPTRYGDWERAGRCVDF